MGFSDPLSERDLFVRPYHVVDPNGEAKGYVVDLPAADLLDADPLTTVQRNAVWRWVGTWPT